MSIFYPLGVYFGLLIPWSMISHPFECHTNSQFEKIYKGKLIKSTMKVYVSYFHYLIPFSWLLAKCGSCDLIDTSTWCTETSTWIHHHHNPFYRPNRSKGLQFFLQLCKSLLVISITLIHFTQWGKVFAASKYTI